MKIAGVFPQQIGNDFLDPDPEESLGIEYILGSAKQAGHEVELFQPINISMEQIVKELIAWKPDVVAMQLYTKHVPKGLRLAHEVKSCLPQSWIIAGGPHPSAVPEFALNTQIDCCVIGEGERTFMELLFAIEKGSNWNTIKGIAFTDNGKLVITPKRPRIGNLDDLPLPIRYRQCYQTPSTACSLIYPEPSSSIPAPVLASRGCASNCNFCSSPLMWQRCIRYRSASEVVRELRHLQENFGVNIVFFEDLSFSSSPERIKELCQEIHRQNMIINWWCQTNVGLVEKELLSVMKEAGCHTIAFGVESLDNHSLQQMGKARSQTVDKIKKAIDLATAVGMITWAYYVIGFPWETKESIMSCTEQLAGLNIHRLRLSIATPLPGSSWFDKINKSTLNPDLSLYDTNHLVYDHPRLTPRQVKELQMEIYRGFYKSPKYQQKVQSFLYQNPYMTKSFTEFLDYTHSQLG